MAGCHTLLCVKVISESEACHDALREATNLLAQTCYVHVHRAVEHEHVLRPYAVDEFLTREHASALVEQQVEQFELGLRERYLLAVNGYGRNAVASYDSNRLLFNLANVL